MDMTVRDLIRSLYLACDGNLDIPFLGVCLSGGEAMAMLQYPSEYDRRFGEFKSGTLYGYMNAAIHKSAKFDLFSKSNETQYIPAIALKRGGISDCYVGPKESIGKTIEI